MHKNEFIKQLAKETTMPQKEVNQVIKSAIDLIARRLKEGDKVVLTGFGTFEVRRRRSRRGVNPQTKERIIIPETSTPGFTASNSLKLNVLGRPGLSKTAPRTGGDVKKVVAVSTAGRPRGRRKVAVNG